jgi:hypothetical protein
MVNFRCTAQKKATSNEKVCKLLISLKIQPANQRSEISGTASNKSISDRSIPFPSSKSDYQFHSQLPIRHKQATEVVKTMDEPVVIGVLALQVSSTVMQHYAYHSFTDHFFRATLLST